MTRGADDGDGRTGARAPWTAKIARYLAAAALVLGAAFTAATGALFFGQSALIFPAPSVADPQPPPGFDAVAISTPDGETLAGFLHGAEPGEATILVFHGNADAAAYQTAKGAALTAAGFGVLLVEYRGYPGSTGTPSEVGLGIDARAAFDFAKARGAGAIGLYGHSLGAGVAVDLASDPDRGGEVFAVALEAPFDSLKAVAEGRFPWAPAALLRHPFRSDLKIGRVKAPILIMHGSRDRVIPIRHGEALAALAPAGAVFRRIDGAGHNDLAAFGATQAAIEFLRERLAAAPG